MNRKMQLLASAGFIAAAAFAASPASAEGTSAGTTITNTVTLNYQVGGIAQPEITASDSFTVDRKINLTVARIGTTTVVSPGQQNAVTAFMVTNTSNATLDFALAAAQLSGGAAPGGGTDNFDAANLRIYLDSNDDGQFDAGDQQVGYLDQIAADDSRRVFVVVDIPLGRTTDDVAAVRLTATAHEANAAGSLGAIVTQTSGANTAGVDTVFADTNANGNVARDGAHFDLHDYTVLAASLSAAKTSRVVSDPFNGTSDPKMIPGAVVEYCIAVANAGGATATNVSVSDALPSETSFLAAFGIRVNGTVTGATCNADGVNGGNFAAGTVSATLSDLAAGETRTVLFRVTVN